MLELTELEDLAFQATPYYFMPQSFATHVGQRFLIPIFLQVPNNYETDLIYPIIQKASELANVAYDTADNQSKTNLKVCVS